MLSWMGKSSGERVTGVLGFWSSELGQWWRPSHRGGEGLGENEGYEMFAVHPRGDGKNVRTLVVIIR